MRMAGLALDPRSGGPSVDPDGRTSDPAIFAAGNVLRGIETAGWCWAEGRGIGRAVATDLVRDMAGNTTKGSVAVEAGGGIKLVMPQRLPSEAQAVREPALSDLQIRLDAPVKGPAGRRSQRRADLVAAPRQRPGTALAHPDRSTSHPVGCPAPSRHRNPIRLMAMRIVALDQGTTSTRALVVEADGTPRIAASLRHESRHPADGRVEQDADALLANLGAVLHSAGPVDAIGLANQGESCLAWDARTGEPLSPVIVWQDTRTAAHLAEMAGDGLDADVSQRAALPLDPYFSASKLAWILREVPRAAQAHAAGRLRLGTTDAFFLDRMAGTFATDRATASRTSLMNIETGEWDPELCQLFSVPLECLPEIRANTVRLRHDRQDADQRGDRRPAGRPLRPWLPRSGRRQDHVRHRRLRAGGQRRRGAAYRSFRRPAADGRLGPRRRHPLCDRRRRPGCRLGRRMGAARRTRRLGRRPRRFRRGAGCGSRAGLRAGVLRASAARTGTAMLRR